MDAPLWLRTAFWISIVIAVVVVVLRVIALAQPPRTSPPQVAQMDAIFAAHAGIILFHILCGLVFALLAPMVLLRWPKGSVWPEHLFFPVGAVLGVSAYAVILHPVGGWIEQSAVLVFNTLFLFSLFRAYQFRSRGDVEAKRRWLVRAVVIVFGIATMRPVMGAFFATSAKTGLQPSQFFGTAFWIGFSINLLVVELWLRSGARRSIVSRAQAA